MPHDEEWKILAEEAAQEQDPKKLIEIVHSLTAAIDAQVIRKAAEQQRKKANAAPEFHPCDMSGNLEATK